VGVGVRLGVKVGLGVRVAVGLGVEVGVHVGGGVGVRLAVGVGVRIKAITPFWAQPAEMKPSIRHEDTSASWRTRFK
jgi:hypothetical protein